MNMIKMEIRKKNSRYHKNYDGMIKFYTIFDVEHDFKKIIEKNSPLKVDVITNTRVLFTNTDNALAQWWGSSEE